VNLRALVPKVGRILANPFGSELLPKASSLGVVKIIVFNSEKSNAAVSLKDEH
jgi:hypothetical protein